MPGNRVNRCRLSRYAILRRGLLHVLLLHVLLLHGRLVHRLLYLLYLLRLGHRCAAKRLRCGHASSQRLAVS